MLALRTLPLVPRVPAYISLLSRFRPEGHLGSPTALPSSHRLNLRLSFCDFYSRRANPVGTPLSWSLALTLKKGVGSNSCTKRWENKFIFFYCCVFHCGFQKLIAERSRVILPGTECEFLTSRDGSGNIY